MMRIALIVAAGAAAAAAALWLVQQRLWLFDFTAGAHWAHVTAAWRGDSAPLRLGFVASFPAAVLAAALLAWLLAALARARSARVRHRRRWRTPTPAPIASPALAPAAPVAAAVLPAPLDEPPASPATPAPIASPALAPAAPVAAGTAAPLDEPPASPAATPAPIASPALAPAAPVAAVPPAPLDEPPASPAATPAPIASPALAPETGHVLAVNAVRERGFYALADPTGAPGFAVAGIAAGRVLLVMSFDRPGSWRVEGATWCAVDGAATIESPVAGALAELDNFAARHGTALEVMDVWVEAVLLVTAATLESAPALVDAVERESAGRLVLCGLINRDDGLPRIEASIHRVDPTRAVPEDLASYARRDIA